MLPTGEERKFLKDVADAMYGEAEWSGIFLSPPESLGAEQISAEGVVMRLQVRTPTGDRLRAARELRMRLKERFAAEGINTPLPLLTAAAAGGGGTP